MGCGGGGAVCRKALVWDKCGLWTGPGDTECLGYCPAGEAVMVTSMINLGHNA